MNLLHNSYPCPCPINGATDGVNSSVKSSTYTPVLGWGTTQTVSNAGGYGCYPSVGIDAFGNCVIIWLENDSGTMGIWGCTLPIGC